MRIFNRCKLWKGSKQAGGYGQIMIKYGNHYTHRLAWMLHHGKALPPKASGKVIDHICKNRACINPKHLELVTQKENMLRGNVVK